MPFTPLHSLTALETAIEKDPLTFLYVTMPNCSVCHGLQPQMEEMMANYPKIATYTLDASEVPEAAGQLSLFTAPVILLFVEGKEYLREARFVQTERLQQKLTDIYQNFTA